MPELPNEPTGPPQPDPNPTTPRSPGNDPILGTGPTADPNAPTTTDPSTQGDSPASTDSTSGGLTIADILAAEQAAGLGQTTTSTPAPHHPEIDQAKAIYFKIWGVEPPHGYIEGLVHQGMNIYEITANEMAKPAFAQTMSYRDQWAALGEQVAQVFGRR